MLALLAVAASRQTGAYEKTGPLFQGRVATDLNLNNVFDRSLVGTELLATNAASLAASARFSHAGESSLVKYFAKLYPNMSRQTFSAMLTLYSSLDCWYETLMPQFGAKPSVDFAADRLSSLTAVDRGRDLLWSRLSSVCDSAPPRVWWNVPIFPVCACKSKRTVSCSRLSIPTTPPVTRRKTS